MVLNPGVAYNGNSEVMRMGMAELPDAAVAITMQPSETTMLIGLLQNGDSVHALVQILNTKMEGHDIELLGALQDRLILVGKKGVGHVIIPYSELNRVNVSCGWVSCDISITKQDGSVIMLSSIMKVGSNYFGDWFNSYEYKDTKEGHSESVSATKSLRIDDPEVKKLEKKKALLRKKVRYKNKLKQARKYERQLDYEHALDLYRELDRVEDIRRINERKMGGTGPGAGATTIVHGNYIDDRDRYTTNIDDRDTIIKDSVVSRANVGAGAGVKERILQLKELHDDGLISDEVFESKKQKLLKP